MRYEVKDILPPESVKKAMEAQMTAEREKRAAMSTGRRRLTEESRIASFPFLPLEISRSIWSMSTTPFLISMPERLRNPSRDMNPKDWPAPRSPAVTLMYNGKEFVFLTENTNGFALKGNGEAVCDHGPCDAKPSRPGF